MSNLNQTPEAQTLPKAKVLSFYYRRTGMGGLNDSVIISFRTKRPIRSALRTSRSGHHGSRLYRLLPAKYLIYAVERSNAGNLYCTISIVRVNNDGGINTVKDWEVCRQGEHLLMLEDLPGDIRELLVSNKDQLPLFDRVFLTNQDPDEDQDSNTEGI